jgi:hypothetical protein
MHNVFTIFLRTNFLCLKYTSTTESRKDASVLNLVLCPVQTKLFRLNCYFRDFSTSSAVSSGLNLEKKRGLNLSFFEVIDKEASSAHQQEVIDNV